jgi:hypothetical protein
MGTRGHLFKINRLACFSYRAGCGSQLCDKSFNGPNAVHKVFLLHLNPVPVDRRLSGLQLLK